MFPDLDSLGGTVVAGCRLIEVVGRGGMAIVYRGQDQKTGEHVAIKVLRPSLDADPHFVKRVAREARITARLRHPHVVAVRNVRQKGGLFFLIMEYVDGESLHDVEKRRGAMELRDAAPLISGILDALVFAHEQNVVHRDIKPENVLVTNEGVPKLADFGIAKSLEGTKLTKTGLSVGTPLYMSPEQVRGLADIDQRTDIYSAGVLVYELLCGVVPFDGTDPVSIGYHHVHAAPVPPSFHEPSICPDTDRFVLKALEKRREDRYESSKEMRRCFQRLLDGSPVPLEIRMPVGRRPPRGPLAPLYKALVATFVVAVILGGIMVLRDGFIVPEAVREIVWAVVGGREHDVLVEDALDDVERGRITEALSVLGNERLRRDLALPHRRAIAARLLEAAIEKHTKDPTVYEELLRMALVFDDGRADSWYHLAVHHLTHERYGSAARAFGRMLTLLDADRAYEFILENEAVLFSRLPKEELAIVGEDLGDLGRRLWRQNDTNRARDMLRKALHYREDQVQVHDTLARLYRSSGDDEQAAYHRSRYEELVGSRR